MVGWVVSRREEESGDMLLLRPYLESNKLLESFFSVDRSSKEYHLRKEISI